MVAAADVAAADAPLCLQFRSEYLVYGAPLSVPPAKLKREREREREDPCGDPLRGPPAGVLNSGLIGVNQRTSSECVPRAVSLAC